MQTHSLLSLPCSIFSQVVCDWIECGDQIRLDSAVCSTAARAALLEILSSPQFVIRWPHELTPEESDERITWAYSRNARISSICFGPRSNLLQYEQFLATVGGSVFAVQVTSVRQTAEKILAMISTYSTNIQTLVLHRTSVERSFQNILNNCPFLNDLRIDSCMFPAELPEQTCASLHTVVLKCSTNIDNTASVLRIASNVKILVLHQCAFEGLHEVSPSVVRLAITDTSLSDEDLIHVAQHCSNITHLSLDSVDTLTDAGVVYAAEHMKKLTSIDLSNCTLPSACLLALIKFRADTLTELFLVQTSDISMKVVNNVVKTCVNLRALGLSCGDGAGALNVSQLSHITRLILIYSGTKDTALVKSIAKHCVHLQHLSLYCVNDLAPCALDDVLHNCVHMQSLNFQLERAEYESFSTADVNRWKSIRPWLEVGERPHLYDILRM